MRNKHEIKHGLKMEYPCILSHFETNKDLPCVNFIGHPVVRFAWAFVLSPSCGYFMFKF